MLENKDFTEIGLDDSCMFCQKTSHSVYFDCHFCGAIRHISECCESFSYKDCPSCGEKGTKEDIYKRCNNLCWLEDKDKDKTFHDHKNFPRFLTRFGIEVIKNPTWQHVWDQIPKGMDYLRQAAELGDPLAFLAMAMVYYTWPEKEMEEAIHVHRQIKHLFPENPNLFPYVNQEASRELYKMV